MGLIPNPVVGIGALFETNFAHNMIHIVTAAAISLYMSKGDGAQLTFMRIFGITYLGVGVIGFVWLGSATEAMLLGFVRIDFLDNFLHEALGTGIFVSVMILGKSRSNA